MYIFAAILLFTVTANGQDAFYKPAVLLYKTEDIGSNTPSELISKNVGNVIKLLATVKDKHDIVVLPEYALSNIALKSADKEYLKPCTTKIGNVKDQACNVTARDTTSRLACAAKENNIYLIVNLIENVRDEKYYVTNVAFDNNGVICAKCRQLHVNGAYFAKTTDQNDCSFTAKFKNNSVKFTLLSSTDILYPIPDAIKSDNVIMTSSLLSTLPVEFGLTMYQAFAAANGVNVIAAGYIDTEQNYGGSGIFISGGDDLVALGPTATSANTFINEVLAKDVPVKASAPTVVSVNGVSTLGNITKMNMNYIKLPELNSTSKELKNCSGERCCNLKADVDGNIAPYKWIMVSNNKTLLDQEVEVLICAIAVPSENFSQKVFNNISISSSVEKGRKSLVMPIVLNQNLLPANFLFDKEKHSITLNKNENIVFFGIMEVIGELSPSGSGGNTTLIVVIVLLILVLVGLLAAFLIWRKRQAKNRRNF